jgi:hypothetical protein
LLTRARPWLLLAALLAGSFVLGLNLPSFTASAADQLADCGSISATLARQHCVSGQAERIMRSDGVRRGISEIDAVAAKYPAVSAVCHYAMHDVGRAQYSPSALAAVITHGVAGPCSQGFAHGMEGQAMASGTSGQAQVLRLCASLRSGTGVAALNCYHGVGHGYRRLGPLAQAIARCATVAPAGSVWTRQCYDGAFMEDNFHLPRGAHESSLQMIARCAPVPAAAAASCYNLVAARGVLEGISPPSTLRACDGAPKGTGQSYCASGVGHMLERSGIKLCSDSTVDAVFSACLREAFADNVQDLNTMTLAQARAACPGFGDRAAACRQAADWVAHDGYGAPVVWGTTSHASTTPTRQ